MELEGISKTEGIIKEAFNSWTDERSDKYTAKYEVVMDARMYMALNHLYMKRKNQTSPMK